MTVTKFISAAALSTLLAGVSSLKTSSSFVRHGYFGISNTSVRNGLTLDVSNALRGGSTGKFETYLKYALMLFSFIC